MEKTTTARKNPANINRRAFIGFTLFDAIHIICAVILMIHAYSTNPINSLLAAESGVEIVFSLLLVVLIACLAEHNEHHEYFHAMYTFAWLVAIASLLIPSTFSIPEIVAFDWTNRDESVLVTIAILVIILYLVIFVLLALTTFTSRKVRRWNHLIHISLILVLVTAVLKITFEIIFPIDNFETIVTIIKDLAPVAPVVISFSLWNNRNFQE